MKRLSVRLLASHGIVALVGAAVAYAVVRLLTPRLYDRHMGGHGRLGSGTPVREAAVDALSTALLIGVLGGIVTAVAVGAFATARILRPLQDVRRATRQMAAGRYDLPVPLPREEELAGVAADVNELAARLAETESRRVRLLGEVAHEMRTPLTVLDGYVEGMVDGLFSATPETLADCAAEVRRLRRLSDDLSALSRAEEGRFDLDMHDLDLGEVAVRAATRLQPQFEDAGVRLGVTTQGALPVHGDPDRLAQVVTNLLGNALVAVGAGGHVDVTAADRAGRATVIVRDDGVGLSTADLDRVFERFYRVPHADGGRRPAGTGIGLTIAQGIARAHGGEVSAASPGPGQGATFTLSVPLSR